MPSRVHGANVVVTGTFDHLDGIGDQNGAARAAHRMGAIIKGRVTRTTKMLIVGHNGGPQKLEDAKTHNVEIMDADDFQREVNLFDNEVEDEEEGEGEDEEDEGEEEEVVVFGQRLVDRKVVLSYECGNYRGTLVEYKDGEMRVEFDGYGREHDVWLGTDDDPDWDFEEVFDAWLAGEKAKEGPRRTLAEGVTVHPRPQTACPRAHHQLHRAARPPRAPRARAGGARPGHDRGCVRQAQVPATIPGGAEVGAQYLRGAAAAQRRRRADRRQGQPPRHHHRRVLEREAGGGAGEGRAGGSGGDRGRDVRHRWCLCRRLLDCVHDHEGNEVEQGAWLQVRLGPFPLRAPPCSRLHMCLGQAAARPTNAPQVRSQAGADGGSGVRQVHFAS